MKKIRVLSAPFANFGERREKNRSMNFLPLIAATLQPSREFRDAGMRARHERQGVDYGKNFIGPL